MHPSHLRHHNRHRAVTVVLLAAVVCCASAGWAANNPKKPAAKAPAKQSPAKKQPAKPQPGKNQPGKKPAAKAPVAPPPPTVAQNLAQQQATEQARKQADAAQAAAIAAGGAAAAGVGVAAASRPPVAPVTPQDPAKLVGVAQAPVQGAVDKRLVGQWAVASAGLPLGTLTITPTGGYVWKKDDSESTGKLLQVVPRRDAKSGVTYWKLKDGTKDYYAFVHPDQKNALAIYAVESNTAAAEATLKDADATAAPKPAATPDQVDKS